MSISTNKETLDSWDKHAVGPEREALASRVAEAIEVMTGLPRALLIATGDPGGMRLACWIAGERNKDVGMYVRSCVKRSAGIGSTSSIPIIVCWGERQPKHMGMCAYDIERECMRIVRDSKGSPYIEAINCVRENVSRIEVGHILILRLLNAYWSDHPGALDQHSPLGRPDWRYV